MIHEQAIVHPSASIADDVDIGPWTIIHADVKIDSGTWIGPHVVIGERTRLGKNNKIFSFSSIGDAPQHLTETGEDTSIEIGDNNTIREYCTLNRGALGQGVTKIGNHNFFMAYVHIAHDCHIGNHTIFVNNASLAGHVVVEDYAYLGGFSGVHQNCTVGAHSFISGAALIPKDVLPYVLVFGNPATVYGLNKVGLKRRGFDIKTLRALDNAYKVIFCRNNTRPQSLKLLEELAVECPAIRLFIEGLTKSSRGIVR